jgi:hypothetical protein
MMMAALALLGGDAEPMTVDASTLNVASALQYARASMPPAFDEASPEGADADWEAAAAASATDPTATADEFDADDTLVLDLLGFQPALVPTGAEGGEGCVAPDDTGDTVVLVDIAVAYAYRDKCAHAGHTL